MTLKRPVGAYITEQEYATIRLMPLDLFTLSCVTLSDLVYPLLSDLDPCLLSRPTSSTLHHFICKTCIRVILLLILVETKY